MDVIAACEWLTWLYGEDFEGRIWIGGHVDGFKGALFANIDDAVAYAARLDDAGGMGVYHRLTTVRDDLPRGRGLAEDSVLLPALMMDLDLHGPGHKATNLPRTREDLVKILDLAEVPMPTTWVESGGGLYAVWKFEQAQWLVGRSALKPAQEISRALQQRVIDAGKTLGVKVDNTSDLARVFRLPGTTNRKVEGAPVTARWDRAGTAGTRYALTDFTPRAKSISIDETRGAPSSPSSSLFGGTEGFTPAAQSSLFAPSQYERTDDSRSFTLADAMAFVTPALDALATAADGEINVRLNEAACMLAHFGPEFWDEAAADRQLHEALSATMYDGRTWRAEDTIASARRAMAGSWRARLVTPVTEATFENAAAAVESFTPDAVDALLAEMLEPGEIIARPAPRFVVHGLLQFDSESWVIGPPGSKKSFVVLDMAARVARGEPWQGRRTNPADVVLVVAEGAGGIGKRLAAWEKVNGSLAGQGVRILPRPVQAGDPAAWGVLVAACARLAASARQRQRGLVVVLDTQARVTVGLKENDATDMGVFVGAVSAIRAATSGCVISVHHTGRAGGDARGSSAIDGAQTTELKVSPGKTDLSAKLSVEKQKDIEEIDDIRLGFQIVDIGVDDDGERLTSLVLADQDSTAFRAAWGDAEAGQDDQEQAKVTPFTARVSLDAWIVGRNSRATWHHRIVQAVVDTAGTLGLTQAEVRKLVREKYGQCEDRTWLRAWQAVTDDSGPWADVMVSAGGQRWTVDPLRVAELLSHDS